MKTRPSSPAERNFVALAGELAHSLSLNRSVGQIYALLYVGREPLSLGEVAERLGMSKGNASINLRALQEWGAVRSVWVNGSRKDHYAAERDLKALILRRIREGGAKRLDMVEGRLAGLAGKKNGDGGDAAAAAQEILGLVKKARKLLSAAPLLAKMI